MVPKAAKHTGEGGIATARIAPRQRSVLEPIWHPLSHYRKHPERHGSPTPSSAGVTTAL